MKHIRFELSEEAEQDLEEIFDYTEKEFGLDKAFEYVSSFDEIFELLVENPFLGRGRPEIREDLRSILFKHHLVFYRIKSKTIRIIRILHGSRDIYWDPL